MQNRKENMIIKTESELFNLYYKGLNKLEKMASELNRETKVKTFEIYITFDKTKLKPYMLKVHMNIENSIIKTSAIDFTTICKNAIIIIDLLNRFDQAIYLNTSALSVEDADDYQSENTNGETQIGGILSELVFHFFKKNEREFWKYMKKSLQEITYKKLTIRMDLIAEIIEEEIRNEMEMENEMSEFSDDNDYNYIEQIPVRTEDFREPENWNIVMGNIDIVNLGNVVSREQEMTESLQQIQQQTGINYNDNFPNLSELNQQNETIDEIADWSLPIVQSIRPQLQLNTSLQPRPIPTKITRSVTLFVDQNGSMRRINNLIRLYPQIQITNNTTIVNNIINDIDFPNLN
jgi:hypothetical protein